VRIAVAGTGQLAVGMLGALLDSHHEVVAVLLDGRSTRGVRRSIESSYLALLAGRGSLAGHAALHRVPTIWLDRMAEELDLLRALAPDVILVGGFGIIFKAPLLELPAIGCVNAHSSLLPKHRGPNPFTHVLLAREYATGVTFHVMDAGIDTGDVLDQARFPITAQDTALSLYRRACTLAAQRVVDVMDRVEREGLKGTPQDDKVATYDPKPTERERFINWQQPAEAIDRQVRAFHPSPMVCLRFRGRVVRVSKASWTPDAFEAEPGTVLSPTRPTRVATGDGVLAIHAAYCSKPFYWAWPAAWNPPRIGERLGGFDG